MRALIIGATGQDGSYLAELLRSKKYEVYGMVRRSSLANNAGRLSDAARGENALRFVYGDLIDPGSLQEILNSVQPDEVYNLGAQSMVTESYVIPEYTAQVTGVGTLRLLELIRRMPKKPKFFQATSSEVYGGFATECPQTEKTAFHPRSPYACAKAFAHSITVSYRETYGIYACSGILFNHDSPRRTDVYVSRKITQAAVRIKLGRQDKLRLGNLEARRDWGYAKDYVEAMWLMLQQEKADDFVIASGESHSVQEFAALAFERLGLDWKKHVDVDPALLRSADVQNIQGDASKARRVLKWTPKVSFKELVHLMVDADLAAEKSA